MITAPTPQNSHEENLLKLLKIGTEEAESLLIEELYKESNPKVNVLFLIYLRENLNKQNIAFEFVKGLIENSEITPLASNKASISDQITHISQVTFDNHDQEEKEKFDNTLNIPLPSSSSFSLSEDNTRYLQPFSMREDYQGNNDSQELSLKEMLQLSQGSKGSIGNPGKKPEVFEEDPNLLDNLLNNPDIFTLTQLEEITRRHIGNSDKDSLIREIVNPLLATKYLQKLDTQLQPAPITYSLGTNVNPLFIPQANDQLTRDLQKTLEVKLNSKKNSKKIRKYLFK